MAMFNALRTYKGHTVARIDGMAASMATIVALGAKRVAMADNGWWMVHNPWGIMAGEAGDMRRQADVMEQIGKTMTATYAAKTGLPESEIKAMMDAETWLTAAEAQAKGFIDEVYPAEGQSFAMAPGSAPIVAKFTHVPAELRNVMKEVPNNQQLSPEQKADSIFSSFSGYDWAAGIRAEFTGGSITEEQARQKILNKLAEGVTPLAGPEAISVYAGNGNIIGDSVKAALLARVGLEKAEKDN